MLLIAGDSWGCGEWAAAPSFTVAHRGLCDFLSTDHTVVNLSRPGGSNWQSYDRIKNFFESGCSLQVKDPITHVFVFQTEWWRDFRLSTAFPSKEQDLYDFSILQHTTITEIMYNWYYRLSDLAQEHSIRIGIIGGISDTEYFDNFETEIPGVFIACQSLINLCINNTHRVDSPCYGVMSNTVVEQLKKYNNNTQGIRQLIQYIDQSLSRKDELKMHKEWFWPDGCHANRNGHYCLYNHIKSSI
jgi:hypothetical protein